MVDQKMTKELLNPISTLDELLSLFVSAVEVSRICNLSRSAANHWFKTDQKERRALPGLSSVVLLADYVGLSDAELGSVIRDLGRIRKEMVEHRNRSKAAAKRETEKRNRGLREQRAKIKQVRRRNDMEAYHRGMDAEEERLLELEKEANEKELYLEKQARLRRLERIERQLHGDNKWE